MTDIHDKERELHLNNEKFKNSEHVSQVDKRHVEKFKNKCFAHGNSESRVSKHISNFHSIFRLAPDWFELHQAEEEELEAVVADINQSDYAESTQADYKSLLKKYYCVMEGKYRGNPHKNEYPDKVDFISTTRDESKIDEPDPLSKEQINEIIQKAQNDRDKAMYKLLYEGGLRSGELMALKLKDIEFEEKGVRIRVPPVKTPERKILVVESERFLKRWISKHPFPDNREAPLWTKIRNLSDETPEEAAISYDYMRIRLKRFCRKLDLRTYKDWATDNKGNPKRDENGNKIRTTLTSVIPYTFRHSRATHLATEMTEAAMKQYFGWKQNSDMPQKYIHLSGKDIDSEIAELYGLETEDDKEENKEKTCARCERTYKGLEKFCPRCGFPFEAETVVGASQVDQNLERIMETLAEGDLNSEQIQTISEVISNNSTA